MSLWALYSPMMMFLGSLGTAFILLYGIGLVRSDEITVGSLVAFIGYLALFYTPINQLHSVNHLLSTESNNTTLTNIILFTYFQRVAGEGKRLH